ncbi:MAG: hypothetical protein RL560_561 [Actinomycetota bacterium]
MPNLAIVQRIHHFFCATPADSLSPGSQLSAGFGGIAKERSVSQTGQDFGANDWLVEEMFERYQQVNGSPTFRTIPKTLTRQRSLERLEVELPQLQSQ